MNHGVSLSWAMAEEYLPQVDQVTEPAPQKEIRLQNLGCELQEFLVCLSSILKGVCALHPLVWAKMLFSRTQAL
jgi:hypothetical protein